MDVILEIGMKKVFAHAVEWPGLGRSGRDEAAALQMLVAVASRYAGAIAPADPGFVVPASTGDLAVLRRFEGSASTDFGGFGVIPQEDARPVSEDDLLRLDALLRACWQALEKAVLAAGGRELLKGPRGGGRDLDGIQRHVLESQAAYLGRIGVKFKPDPSRAVLEETRRCGQTVLDGLAAAARGHLPSQGPRGGVYWPPRYFARTVAWHVLDHAWEIEDRMR